MMRNSFFSNGSLKGGTHPTNYCHSSSLQRRQYHANSTTIKLSHNPPITTTSFYNSNTTQKTPLQIPSKPYGSNTSGLHPKKCPSPRKKHVKTSLMVDGQMPTKIF
jgi:hypothetical protein